MLLPAALLKGLRPQTTVRLHAVSTPSGRATIQRLRGPIHGPASPIMPEIEGKDMS